LRQHDGAAALRGALGAGDINEDLGPDALLAFVGQFDAKAEALSEADIVIVLGYALRLPRGSGIGLGRRFRGGRILRGRAGGEAARDQRGGKTFDGIGYGNLLSMKRPSSLVAHGPKKVQIELQTAPQCP